jgi:cyclic di-GMP phosphodiesterase
LTADSADRSKHGATPQTLPTGERILLIDDEAQMRRALLRALSASGYACMQAGNASEARAMLEGDPFDLVICDLRVSEEGLELLDEIEHRHRETALLMVSGDPSLAQVAGEHGVSAYLIKPFSDNELRTNVALALGHAERKRRRLADWDPFEREAEMLERLNEVIASRDLKTGIHTRAVGRLSANLGEACGLDQEMVRRIRIAAPMHDIGKIAMPDVILMKPSPLTGAERAFMQRHAQIGHDLLAGTGSPVLDLAAEIALTHHEHFDGSGYPRGLAGDRIPLVGRIVAIADVFDALISDRPYRQALTPRDALEEMLGHRGGRFDPSLLDLFVADFNRILRDLEELGFSGS